MREIGRKLGQLHEINDQAGIIARLVDHSALVPNAGEAPRMVAEAFRAMASGRRGPAALECPINVWGKPGDVTPLRSAAGRRSPRSTRTRCAMPRSCLGAAKNPMIVGRRRRAGRVAGSDGARRACCRRRCCAASAAARACSTAAIRSP